MRIRQKLMKVFGSRYLLAWAVIAGLSFRVLWGFSAGDAYRYYDSDSYVKIADSLLSGQGFLWGDPQTGQRMGRPPLYPMLVAATRFAVAGQQFILLYIVQALLGTLSIIFFASGARRLVGRVAGGITALLVAFDPFLVFYSGTVLSETLFVFFLSALFYSVVIILDRPGFVASLVAGLMAGGAFLTRPSVPGVLLLFALAVLVWAYPRRKAILSVATMLVVSALVVMPWAVRNHRLSGRWVFTTLGVGASLYDAVGPQADGSSNMDFLLSPELASMDEMTRDGYLLSKSIDAILDSPGRVLKLAPVKAWRFWTPMPNNEDFRSPLYVAVSLLAMLPVYLFAVLSIFSGALRRRDFFVLACAPVYFTLVHMVFVGSIRYRCPIMPFVGIIASAAVAAFLARGKKGFAAAFRAVSGARADRGKTIKMASSRKRRGLWSPFRVILLLMLLLGVVIMAGYAYYAYWFTNPSNVRALAMDKIGILFPGKQVKVAHAEFGLLTGLDLRGVEIAEPDVASAPVAKLDYVHIDFARRGLLRFALIPKSVSASGLYLELVRGEDGKWNLALPFSDAVGSAPTAVVKLGKKLAPRQRMVARGFTMSLRAAFVSVDDRLGRYSVSFTIDSIAAAADEKRPAVLNVTLDFGGGLLGKWRVNGRVDAAEKSFDAEFHVADIDLGQGLRNRLPSPARAAYDLFNLSGAAAVSGACAYVPVTGWDFDVAVELDGCGALPKRFPVALRNLRGKVRFTRGGCSFARLTANAAGGNLACSGRTSGYSAQSAFSLTLDAADVEATQELLSALDEDVRGAIVDFNPRGAFDVSAKISRDNGADKPVGVSIDIYPKGMSAMYQGFPYAVDQLRGRLTYANRAVEIVGLDAVAGPARLHFGGYVRGIGQGMQASIAIEAKGLPLDGKLHDALPEEGRRIWDKLSLSGACDLNVTLANTPGAPPALEFSAGLANVSVVPPDFPYALSNGKGTVEYKADEASLDSFSFTHGDARISADGKAAVSSGAFNINVVAADIAVDRELVNALPRAAADFVRTARLTGTGNVAFTVSRGRDGSPEFRDLCGGLTGASFTLPELPLDFGAADVSFALSDACLEVARFEGSLIADAGVSLLPVLRYAALARPRTQASAAGAIGIGQKRDRSVRFEVTGLFVDDSLLAKLPDPVRQVITDAKPRGLVDIAGDWSYIPDGPGISRYEGLLDCAGVGFSAGWQFENITGDVAVRGRMEGSASALSLDANLTSISLGGKDMGDTCIRLVQEPDEVRLERFQTRMFGGVLEGQGRMFFAGKPSYAFFANARGMNLSDVLDKAFGFRREGLSGTLGARIKILSLTGKNSDTIGSADADVQDGALWEVPVILAMMNVLNLRLPERTQFNSAHTRLEWNNKGTFINELSMSSDPATIFGQGSIDAKGNLDMLFYSRPGRIPIVSLLAGEVSKNIAKAHMAGTFAQPRTSLVPGGLFGKLVEALTPHRKRESK